MHTRLEYPVNVIFADNRMQYNMSKLKLKVIISLFLSACVLAITSRLKWLTIYCFVWLKFYAMGNGIRSCGAEISLSWCWKQIISNVWMIVKNMCSIVILCIGKQHQVVLYRNIIVMNPPPPRKKIIIMFGWL